jgi:uncharacterized protein YciW
MICDWSIGDLPGLQNTERALLQQWGITTTGELLSVAPDAATKQKLAKNLGTKIQYVNKLAQMPAHKIHQQLLRLHVATLQRRDLCPDISQVQNWIKQAQGII